MRLVFMGTPDFAVKCLEPLIQSEHPVLGVVTNPDKVSGRGRSKKAPPVKEKALEYGLPLLQPDDLQDPAFLQELQALGADLHVVVAFRLLPQAVLDIPPYGSINLHASLLPSYRGAAPIQRALMNGERITGLSSFLIDEGMDRGGLLLQESVGIPTDMTAGELHDLLAEKGGPFLLRTIDGLEDGSLTPYPQEKSGYPVTRAPKIDQEDRRLDMRRSAKEVHDHIRAMSPVPGIMSELERKEGEDMKLKLLRSRVYDSTTGEEAPGTVTEVQKDRLIITTGQGRIELLELQPEGKKRMKVEEFLRGYKVRKGDRFR